MCLSADFLLSPGEDLQSGKKESLNELVSSFPDLRTPPVLGGCRQQIGEMGKEALKRELGMQIGICVCWGRDVCVCLICTCCTVYGFCVISII